MGGLLNRSSAQGDIKKQKRRHQELDRTFESDPYLVYDGNENVQFISTHELWDKEFGQQQMMYMNDAPGAPRTYSPNYLETHNNTMPQSWSSFYDVNNSFYPINSLRMTTSYNIPDQYNHAQIPKTINNPSRTVIPKERSSKKSQLSSSHQRQQTSTTKPLTSTQSWHESNIKTNDMSVQTRTKFAPLSNRSSMPKISPVHAPVEKAVYIGIDHQATLAERGQTVANRRHRKNPERNHSDRLNSPKKPHRTRSHTNHHHQHRTPTDSPNTNNNTISNKSMDVLQSKSSNSQRIITKSPLTNKSTQNIDQISMINNEIKPTKSRSNHQQQSSVNNEIKPSKTRENHRQHRRHHQQHLATFSYDPSLNTQSPTRWMENKQPNAPVMHISSSQFNQQHPKQPILLSTATTTSVTRTRI